MALPPRASAVPSSWIIGGCGGGGNLVDLFQVLVVHGRACSKYFRRERRQEVNLRAGRRSRIQRQALTSSFLMMTES